jgi:hypothetical protein
MAVLCEALSVIIRCHSVDCYFQGGPAAFVRVIPNQTFCTDGELLRVGFMSPDDVRDFVEMLERNGLQFNLANPDDDDLSNLAGRRPERDIVIIDQLNGPTVECDWVIVKRMRITETAEVTVAYMSGSALQSGGVVAAADDNAQERRRRELHTPVGWTYEGSLSASAKFVDNDDIPRRLKYLREQDNFDVYLDTETRKEMFLARTR